MNQTSVFMETYQQYLAEIAKVDFHTAAPILGGQVFNDALIIPVLGTPYRISGAGIVSDNDPPPTFIERVILARYVLLCPQFKPKQEEWTSYRDLKDSGPLTVYFQHDVEQKIAKAFAWNCHGLEQAADRLGGYAPDIPITFDLARQFDFLPNIPILMLFNDADEDFPANCRILFRRSVETYLDAECIAMAGNFLAVKLISIRADEAKI